MAGGYRAMVGAFGFHSRRGLVDGGRLGQPHERRPDPRGYLGFRQFRQRAHTEQAVAGLRDHARRAQPDHAGGSPEAGAAYAAR